MKAAITLAFAATAAAVELKAHPSIDDLPDDLTVPTNNAELSKYLDVYNDEG